MNARSVLRTARWMSTTITPPPDLTERGRIMFYKLNEHFKPTQLKIDDTSGGCGQFYKIYISSPVFKDIQTIKRHRMVNEVLRDDIKSLHGMTIDIEAE